MKPSDILFGMTGRSVDDRVDGIAKTAREVLESMQRTDSEDRTVAGQKRRKRKLVGHWAAGQLDLCVRTFERLPPAEIVDLFTYLHESKVPLTALHPDQWYRAAHYKAMHSDASLRDLAAASGVTHTTCARWLKNSDFKAEVEEARAAIETLGIEQARRLGFLTP